MPKVVYRFMNGLFPVIGFLLLAVVVGASFVLVIYQQQAQRDVVQTMSAITSSYRILSLLQEAETGQRGYLLTHDEAYLEPYSAARLALDQQFAVVGQLFSDVGENQMLVSLQKISQDKLAELASTIARAHAGDFDGALSIVATSQGKRLMDRARETVDRFLEQQRSTFAVRQAKEKMIRFYLRWIVIGAALLVVIVAAMTLWNSRNQIRALTAALDQVEETNRQLTSEAGKRELLETQLRQSQKMEAIGQLTGGLAHDFNNLLAVVMGSLEMASRRLARGETDIGRYITNAMDGAERGAKLTHRMLAFARQQPLAPQPTDANRLISDLSDLLRRTLEEHIQLETVLSGGLWRANIDSGQLENALVNLAVNARDAMAAGGKLTIETQNAALDETYASTNAGVPSGQYVLIAVTDTGIGMSPEAVEKAFEPFFTTKEPGKGTGLGLSQVYGFVKQSLGHIKIYSEIGHGTTVKIYLPRFYGSDKTPETKVEAKLSLAGSKDQVILVVEDDDKVRRSSVESLQELGYTVLQARDGTEALSVLDQRSDIDLLFSDIVMPGMNGRQLADDAAKRHPNLLVLFTTGYTRNAIIHNGVLDPGTNLLTKPFTYDELSRKVSGILAIRLTK